MATSVTINDVWAWMNTGSRLGDSATPTYNLDQLQWSLDAATEQIESQCSLPDVYPQSVELAIIMTAARLYKRTGTPEGLTTFQDFGAIRVSAFDADVDNLIMPYRRWNLR